MDAPRDVAGGSGPSRGQRVGLALLLFAAVGLDAGSCVARPPRVEPVAAGASAALADARLALRRRAPGWRERARELAERARSADPGWVAPRRFLDDLAREELRAPEVLAERLAELDLDRGDARRQYLVGRLEGPGGVARFQEAQRLDDDLAWAHHGEGWLRFQAGELRAALRSGRRALERARDGWERVNFAIALSRYELARERPEAAVEVLDGLVDADDLAPGDRAQLLVRLARCELVCDEEELVERGFWRGIDLLREAELTAAELSELGAALLLGADRLAYREAVGEIESALAAGSGFDRAARDRVRAHLLFERGATELALGAARRAGAGTVESPAVERAARLARGDGGAVIEAWLAELPSQVLDEDGLPARAELRRLVETARAARGTEGAERLAEALLAAGWFREARGLATALASDDVELALAVDARAASGLALLGGIRRLLDLIDSKADYAGPRAGAPAADADHPTRSDPASERVASLDELLGAMEPLFERHGAGDGTPALVGSARLSFGPFAEVVHPGPRFSAEDERLGRGPRGEEVGGLAHELLALGRFGIFGESVGGGGPDGTVLRLLRVEQRGGEHLGVGFAGTVAWCEGTDVPSRPMRQGARITGAAVHEGYWIDVEGVRAELRRWRALERDFLAGEGERARRALAGRGPELPGVAEASGGTGATGAAWADPRPRSIAAPYAPLGAADRVRLAVLVERPASGDGAGGRTTLEELLEVVALHEEGHLTDRTRFLPLTRHVLGALGLLFDAGLSPAGVARILEYRAQLVALCVAPDPRIPLAECLDGVENGGGVTPHAAAYGSLVADLLRVLARDVDAWPELDREHYLIHQLHHLGPEDVRRAAVALAHDKGMVPD